MAFFELNLRLLKLWHDKGKEFNKMDKTSEGDFRKINSWNLEVLLYLRYIMDNPKVKAYFQTLDVDVHEGEQKLLMAAEKIQTLLFPLCLDLTGFFPFILLMFGSVFFCEKSSLKLLKSGTFPRFEAVKIEIWTGRRQG